MATIGRTSATPPSEPWNGAPPKLLTSPLVLVVQ